MNTSLRIHFYGNETLLPIKVYLIYHSIVLVVNKILIKLMYGLNLKSIN